jgi:hypothetical protein
VHWPSRDSPYLLLASVSIGANDDYDLTELPTEHIYTLKLDGLGDDQAMSFNASLECLTRIAPSADTFVHAPFVRYSLLLTSFVVC